MVAVEKSGENAGLSLSGPMLEEQQPVVLDNQDWYGPCLGDYCGPLIDSQAEVGPNGTLSAHAV
jgi:hypothetical protein